MSSQQADKPIKPKLSWIQRLRRISGTKRDLLIIIAGIFLGASTQFFFAHIYYLTNCLLGMLGNWICRHPDLLETGKQLFWEHIQVSLSGMVIEMAIIVAVILFLVYFFRSSDREEEMISILKEIRDTIKPSVGGGNATTESEANKKKADEAKKESEKGGET